MPSRSLTRRRALQASALGSISSLAGCFGRVPLPGGTVDIHVENLHNQRHEFTVEFRIDGKVRFSEHYTIPPEEESRTSDAVEAGEYTVVASTESGARETLRFHMNGCRSNELNAITDRDGTINLLIGVGCD